MCSRRSQSPSLSKDPITGPPAATNPDQSPAGGSGEQGTTADQEKVQGTTADQKEKEGDKSTVSFNPISQLIGALELSTAEKTISQLFGTGTKVVVNTEISEGEKVKREIFDRSLQQHGPRTIPIPHDDGPEDNDDPGTGEQLQELYN